MQGSGMGWGQVFLFSKKTFKFSYIKSIVFLQIYVAQLTGHIDLIS